MRPGSIALGQTAADFPAAIHMLVGLMAQNGNLTDPAAYEADVLAREHQASTCMGRGIAIPHAKSSGVARPGLAAVTLAAPGLNCGAPGGPVRLLFMIAAPADSHDLHVQTLARLAGVLMDEAFCARLLAADTPQDFLALIATREDAQDLAHKAVLAAADHYRLLAVTACPAGLAHTYLGAEALHQAAHEQGVSIKIETNGATGVGNALTATEIADADCIIVAADKAVPMDRFIGKPVLEVSVGAAVREPAAVITQALAGTAPLYRGETAAPSGPGTAAQVLRELYRHLMNGVSHMLPFVTGGGLLIALGLVLAQWFGVPPAVTDLLHTTGEASFALMYPVLAAFIAQSLGGQAAFVPGLVGGWFAQQGITTLPQADWVTSGFWGALAAGFAAGALMRLVTTAGEHLPKALDQPKTALLYPAITVGLIGALMALVINPPLGQFNEFLYQLLQGMQGGSRLVLCGVLGALMAVDYGGPVNKAAYLFGAVALVNGQYDIMASVMLGGMVPPLGVALACLLFPDRFTPAERRTAPQNLLLRASFVTEGALPFALKDPLRVIPSCCFGSGLAGVASLALGCGCPAPHGGLFLLPVLTNPGGFCVALLSGAAATALLLGVTKKPLGQKAQ